MGGGSSHNYSPNLSLLYLCGERRGKGGREGRGGRIEYLYTATAWREGKEKRLHSPFLNLTHAPSTLPEDGGGGKRELLLPLT